jgi:hypothetical protein
LCYNFVMLAQLLSSKPKSRLVNLFLAHPSRSFSLTELRQSTDSQQKLLMATIKELARMGFLTTLSKERNKYYQVNKHFPLYPELTNLLRKIKKPPVDFLAREAVKVGDCKLIVLTGVFAGKPRVETDVLFVGKVSQARLSRFLKLAEKFAEREISYTIFTMQEYEYRKIMNDRFIKNIMENEPLVLMDKLKNKTIAKLVYKR